MADLNRTDAPLVDDKDNFNEDYREFREKAVSKITQSSVTSADAGGTYGAAEQKLLNDIKDTLNSLIGKLE